MGDSEQWARTTRSNYFSSPAPYPFSLVQGDWRSWLTARRPQRATRQQPAQR